jgi:hypothetical protein
MASVRKEQIGRLKRAVADIRAAACSSTYDPYTADPAVRRAQAVLAAAERNASAAELAEFRTFMS